MAKVIRNVSNFIVGCVMIIGLLAILANSNLAKPTVASVPTAEEITAKEAKKAEREAQYAKEKDDNLKNITLLVQRGVKIDDGAIITDPRMLKPELLKAAQRLITLNGYKCTSISSAIPFVFATGFSLSCNGFRYSYDIEDKGGNWTVTLK